MTQADEPLECEWVMPDDSWCGREHDDIIDGQPLCYEHACAKVCYSR